MFNVYSEKNLTQKDLFTNPEGICDRKKRKKKIFNKESFYESLRKVFRRGTLSNEIKLKRKKRKKKSTESRVNLEEFLTSRIVLSSEEYSTKRKGGINIYIYIPK